MVNDHRTELKIPDVHRVMDGDMTRSLKRISSSGLPARTARRQREDR